jgi:hypothetical protein
MSAPYLSLGNGNASVRSEIDVMKLSRLKWIPRNAVALVGASPTPVLKLASHLVELVFSVQRGVDFHDHLQVIGFM